MKRSIPLVRDFLRTLSDEGKLSILLVLEAESGTLTSSKLRMQLAWLLHGKNPPNSTFSKWSTELYDLGMISKEKSSSSPDLQYSLTDRGRFGLSIYHDTEEKEGNNLLELHIRRGAGDEVELVRPAE